MSTDEYRLVTVTVCRISDGAILIDVLARAHPVWVPRSLLHAADDLALDGARPGEDRTIRLRAWKAEEIGLAGVGAADRQGRFLP